MLLALCWRGHLTLSARSEAGTGPHSIQCWCACGAWGMRGVAHIVACTGISGRIHRVPMSPSIYIEYAHAASKPVLYAAPAPRSQPIWICHGICLRPHMGPWSTVYVLRESIRRALPLVFLFPTGHSCASWASTGPAQGHTQVYISTAFLQFGLLEQIRRFLCNGV